LNRYLYIESYINKLLTMAANASSVDKETMVCIYEQLLKELKNPYLVAEYLIIKSIDTRLAKKAIQKGDKVLNIGCGYPINEMIIQSWGIADRIVGIDLSEGKITSGTKWLNDLGIKNVELYRQDALSLSFPQKSSDVVLSFSAIEHVKGWANYEKWAENMSSIAKREIVLTTSNKNNALLSFLGRIVKMDSYEHFFAPGEIEYLLTRYGYKVTYFETSTLWTSAYIPYLPGRLKFNPITVGFDLTIEKLFGKILKSCGGRMGFIAKKTGT